MKIHLDGAQVSNLNDALSLGQKFLSLQNSKVDEAVVRLSLSSNNLLAEIGASDFLYRPRIKVSVENSGSSLLVNAKLFHKIMELDVTEHSATIEAVPSAGMLKVSRGSSTWLLPILDHHLQILGFDESKDELLSFPGAVMNDALRKVHKVEGGDMARPFLRALDCKNGKVRACNGHIYAHYDTGIKSLNFSIPSHLVRGLHFFIDRFASPYNKDRENVIFYYQDLGNVVHFTHASFDFFTAKPLLDFPDLDKIIVRPAKSQVPAVLKVNKAGLDEAVSRASLTIDKSNPMINLAIQEKVLTVSCTDASGGSSSSSVTCQWLSSPLEATFYYPDFRKLLNNIELPPFTNDVELRFSTNTKTQKTPLVVEGDRTWSLINQVTSR